MRKPSRRKCANKSCRQWFHPTRDGQMVCSYECACAAGKEQTAKKRADTQREEKKQREEEEKKGRQRHAERLKAVKPLSHWVQMTQRAYNDWRREYLLSLGHSCISCGTGESFSWHAGHYRTTASAPQLRFTDDNVWLQCFSCNVHKSGNIEPYRIALVELIGESRIQPLENNNEIHRYTREELDGIRAAARANLRTLKKQEAA